MADLSHTHHGGAGLRHRLTAPFAALDTAFRVFGEAVAQARRVEHLMSLTDSQLAARGLRRDEVVTHVFRDAQDR